MSIKPSFETLVDTHGREIFAYLWRLLMDPHDAEDCFQDTFLRAYKAYPRLGHPANYRAWVYKIATNTAATFLKKRSRLASRTASLDSNVLTADLTFHENIDVRFTLQEVRTAVEALPKKQKAALLLRNYQGLSYNEIGLALDTSPSAALGQCLPGLTKITLPIS